MGITCSARARLAREASPVESEWCGWHHSGTEPTPAALSQRWPSRPAPRPSEPPPKQSITDVSAGQTGTASPFPALSPEADPSPACEWARLKACRRRLLPEAMGPRSSTIRQSSGTSISPPAAVHSSSPSSSSSSTATAAPLRAPRAPAQQMLAPGNRSSRDGRSGSGSSITSNDDPSLRLYSLLLAPPSPELLAGRFPLRAGSVWPCSWWRCRSNAARQPEKSHSVHDTWLRTWHASARFSLNSRPQHSTGGSSRSSGITKKSPTDCCCVYTWHDRRREPVTQTARACSSG